MSDFFSALLRSPRYLPLLVLVVLMLPAWVSWIFLSDKRQKSALAMVKELRQWATGDAEPSGIPNEIPNAIADTQGEPNPHDSDV